VNALKKVFRPGSAWVRVNHRYPDREGGRILAPVGTPVRCQVERVHSDSVAFKLERGTIAYLSWPQPPLQVNISPDKVEISDDHGALLTYTAAPSLSEGQWIPKSYAIDDEECNCLGNAERLADENPKLRFTVGYAKLPGKRWGEHAWCVTPRGQIIDPYFQKLFPKSWRTIEYKEDDTVFDGHYEGYLEGYKGPVREYEGMTFSGSMPIFLTPERIVRTLLQEVEIDPGDVVTAYTKSNPFRSWLSGALQAGLGDDFQKRHWPERSANA
jgi:hypothetical protein